MLDNVGFYSYLFACASYLVLGIVLLSSSKADKSGLPIKAATVATFIWAVLITLSYF
jgi:hypothetical protein